MIIGAELAVAGNPGEGLHDPALLFKVAFPDPVLLELNQDVFDNLAEPAVVVNRERAFLL